MTSIEVPMVRCGKPGEPFTLSQETDQGPFTKTLILLILDESGSMEPKKADVIGGYKSFLVYQKKLPDEARLHLTTFNTIVTSIRIPQAIQACHPLSLEVKVGHHHYSPDGNT